MADKIREALFSSLQSMGIRPSRVLDLYAGTGSVGIEALSRGADSAVFVDRQNRACRTITSNLAATGFRDRTRVISGNVHKQIETLQESFDFIIVDPPYADPDIGRTLEKIGNSSLVQSGSVIVLGHWPRFPETGCYDRLHLLKRRCHGDSCFSIFEVISDTDLEGNPTGG